MCEGGEGGVGVCAPALGDVAGVLKGGRVSKGWMEEWWLGDGTGRESEGRLTPWTGGIG
jgi:hypothetical protein